MNLSDAIGRGALAARPSAGVPGRLYYATDQAKWYRDNGTGWDEQGIGTAGGGDMTKAVYDTNNDGVVDNAEHAVTADSATSATSATQATNASNVPWAGVTGKPTTFTPTTHQHAGSDITSGTLPPARLGSGAPDSTTFLRGDGAWAVPTGSGGGGAATSAKYITAAADGSLSNEVVIPALAAWPDRVPAAPKAEDDEFDSASANAKWTITSTAKAVDYNTTWPSHVCAQFDGAQGWRAAQSYAPAGDFSITAAFTAALQADYMGPGIHVYDAAKLEGIAIVANHNSTRKAELHVLTGGVWTYGVAVLELPLASKFYLYVGRSGSTWKAAISLDGMSFYTVGTTSKTMTVASFDVEMSMGGATSPACAMGLDWVRRDWVQLPASTGTTAPPPPPDPGSGYPQPDPYSPRPALAANLLGNPGFESGSGSTPSTWVLTWRQASNSITRVTTDKMEGSYSLYFNIGVSDGGVVQAESNAISATGHNLCEVTGNYKGNSVSGGFEVKLYAYDSANALIKSFGLHGFGGGITGWRNIGQFRILPANTSYVKIQVKMPSGTGYVWCDDFAVRMSQTLPSVTLQPTPVVIPRPAKVVRGANAWGFTSVAWTQSANEPTVEGQLNSWLQGLGITAAKKTAGDPTIANYNTYILFGDGNSSTITTDLARAFPGISLSQVGPEGYFLSVQRPGAQTLVYIGANSEAGRKWALMTLKQLVNAGVIYQHDLLDWPTIPVRGIIMSASRFGSFTTQLQNMLDAKMNTAWNQGSWQGEYWRYWWRTPFTTALLNELKSYHDATTARGMTTWWVLQPRGHSTSYYGYGTTFSSTTDITDYVNKIKQAADYTGHRHFAISFDDLWNIGEDTLLSSDDIARWGQNYPSSLGKAHMYFASQVYQRLIGMYPDLQFRVLPLYCYFAGGFGSREDSYLSEMATLPASVLSCTVQYYDSDYLRNYQVTGNRKTLTWSNFYAEGYDGAAGRTYAIPYYPYFLSDWTNAALLSTMEGLLHLPLQPGTEDAALVHWRTAADMYWAPDRYNPTESFNRAASKYQGR